MNSVANTTRRSFLKTFAIGLTLIPLLDVSAGRSWAADMPLVTADDPTAKTLKYVDDAHHAKGAKPGSKCANCALYQGEVGSTQGPCPLFAGKQVKAAGWCASWSPQV